MPSWTQTLFRPAQRTVGYLSREAGNRRRDRFSEMAIPEPARSPGVIGNVAVDEMTMALFQLRRRHPTPEDIDRISTELDDALELYASMGWLDDPASYHPKPPPLSSPTVRTGRGAATRLRFPSDWAPRPHEPGRARWLSYGPNHVARALVFRHAEGARPWIVCVHGAEMGRAYVDPYLFRVRHLHDVLGCNVVLPLLPLHGPRRAHDAPEAQWPNIDLLDNVHGLAQAAWDVRRLLTWVRNQDPAGIAVIGLSLGSAVAALVAGLEEPLDCVIAGIPAVDFPQVFRRATPPELRAEHEFDLILGSRADRIHRVVSPLSFTPATPVERRFIFGGVADRLIDPVEQTGRLWEHWGRCEIHWFAGGHVGGLRRADVGRFVDQALTRSGLVIGR